MLKTERFTLRLPSELDRKLSIVSKKNLRSKNKEIEFAIKRYITDYERHYGIINLD